MAGDQILAAVHDVLAERGVDKLSIRSVAQAAQVSPAQVQYYYRTKRELVRAGFEYSQEKFLASITEARPKTLGDLVLLWLPLDETRDRRARVWLAYTEIAARDQELASGAARIDAELRQWFRAVGVPDPQAIQLLALIDGATTQCLVLPLARREDFARNNVLTFLDHHDLNLNLPS